jgi:gas vesicle protein
MLKAKISNFLSKIMTSVEDQLLKRNLEILLELNDNILTQYKSLKKDLSQQKDGTMNEAIQTQMQQISQKTSELNEEVSMRLPTLAYPKELVK